MIEKNVKVPLKIKKASVDNLTKFTTFQNLPVCVN